MTKDGFRLPDPSTWYCPGCGREAKIHWRRDLGEYERQKLRVAIGHVNAALYVRDHEKDFVGVPANIFMLDRLPDAWKAQDVKLRRGTKNRDEGQ
jgi:hypothetical protein